jgi:hypothetical protein
MTVLNNMSNQLTRRDFALRKAFATAKAKEENNA